MKPILLAGSALALITACASAPDPAPNPEPQFFEAAFVAETSEPIIEVVETVTLANDKGLTMDNNKYHIFH